MIKLLARNFLKNIVITKNGIIFYLGFLSRMVLPDKARDIKNILNQLRTKKIENILKNFDKKIGLIYPI